MITQIFLPPPALFFFFFALRGLQAQKERGFFLLFQFRKTTKHQSLNIALKKGGTGLIKIIGVDCENQKRRKDESFS